MDDDKTAPATGHSGTKSVVAAIIANIAVGIVKFIAAAISGSSAMLSEGIHSIVDSGNGILVLYGLRRSRRKPTLEHPFGFGKELYFWTLVVAVSIFALGGGVSLMEGIAAIRESLSGGAGHGSLLMSFIVLVAAMVIEGVSLRVAVKEFNAARGSTPVLRFIRDCKDPSLYTVLLEDTAAELGLACAFMGLVLTAITGNPIFDGIAAVVIGVLLMAVSVVLLTESKGLLVGEGMTKSELEEARRIVEGDPAVTSCGGILTMYFGPQSMLVTVDVNFDVRASVAQCLQATDRIEDALRARFPQAQRIYIEPEELEDVRRQRNAAAYVLGMVAESTRY